MRWDLKKALVYDMLCHPQLTPCQRVILPCLPNGACLLKCLEG